MFTLRIRTLFLIFFTCVILPVYGTAEAPGLKINWTRFSIPPSYKSPDIKSKEPIVCELLTDTEYEPWHGEIETVSYNLYKQDIGVEPSDGSAVDTDTEEESEGNIQSSSDNQVAEIDNKVNDELPEANKADISRKLSDINRSRHPRKAMQPEEYDPIKNYVKDEVDDSFAHQLSTDAHALLDLLPSDQSKLSTTFLCVALHDKHGYIKKFAFHNGAGIMAPTLRNQAHALGYDVIQVDQSHAEGAFIQFLLRRHQVRPAWYTHIMGIGCSRLVCAECDHLFKLFFGKNYQEMCIASAHNETRAITVTRANMDCCFSLRESATGNVSLSSFVPIYQKRLAIKIPGTVLNSEAIDANTYPNYYLPICLQQAIQYLASRSIDFSNERFSKSRQVQHNKKKRG